MKSLLFALIVEMFLKYFYQAAIFMMRLKSYKSSVTSCLNPILLGKVNWSFHLQSTIGSIRNITCMICSDFVFIIFSKFFFRKVLYI